MYLGMAAVAAATRCAFLRPAEASAACLGAELLVSYTTLAPKKGQERFCIVLARFSLAWDH